jgi:outer membrane protein OmpU
MKYQLFGSTALAVIGLLAPAAQAADGITLHLGGRYMGAAGVVPSEDFSPSSGVSDSDVRNYVFKQDVRVYFEGESTLDNGLQVGARVDLRGQTDTTDQLRDVYAYVSGGFG